MPGPDAGLARRPRRRRAPSRNGTTPAMLARAAAAYMAQRSARGGRPLYSPGVAPGTLTGTTYRVTGTAERDVQDLLACLDHAVADRAPFDLDLRELDEGNASARRLGPWWVASLTNLLAGRFSDVPLRIALPAERSVRLQLLRGGLYYALAQRPGSVDYAAIDDASRDALKRSSGTWTSQQGPVLFEEASGTPAGGRSYLYANTHSTAEDGFFRRYEGSAAFPFLGDAIPLPSASAGHEVREMFLLSACEALVEVLDNFSKHAFNLLDSSFDADWLGPMIVDRARSCLLVSVTTGGTDSYDRLHFIALDNGLCIPRTMRWKHPMQLHASESTDIVERVLRERLTYRDIDGHVGAGLWCLSGLASFAGGTISVISEDDLSDGRSATRIDVDVPAIGADDQSLSVERRSARLPWRGTTVHMQIRIPRLDDVDEHELEEIRHRLRRYRTAVPQPV